MNIDDLEPIRPEPTPKNLEEMSIEALSEYIAELEAEIVRVREVVAIKRAAQTDADSFFKKN